MSLSKYPNQLDVFVDKTDATYEGDPNGDIVFADDVNYLQDSIYAMQRVMGIEPQGNKETIKERLDEISSSDSLLSSIYIHKGNLLSINDKTTEDEIVKELNKLGKIVINSDLILLDSNKERNLKIINKLNKKPIILVTLNLLNKDISNGTLMDSLTKLKELEFEEIFWENFNTIYENKVEEINVLLNFLKNKKFNFYFNIRKNLKESLSEYEALLNPQANKLNFTESSILVVDTQNFIEDYENRLKFLEDYEGFKLSGLGTYTKGSSSYELNALAGLSTVFLETENNEVYTMPTLDYKSNMKGYPKTDIYSELITSVSTENKSNGFTCKIEDGEYVVYGNTNTFIKSDTIQFNKNFLEGSYFKDGSINYSKLDLAGAGNLLIDTINEDETTHKITLDKIVNFDLGEGGVTEAIIVEVLNANVMNALNAYIGDATINSALIGNLDASKITTGDLSAERIRANVIDAINLYASNITAESALINSAIIGELDASKITTGELDANIIKGNVIDAINLSARQADIENLNADNLKVGYVAAERLSANVVSAINIYASTIVAGDAKINNAVIDELTAQHIKVAVIDAINANIGTATIDGAIIGNATITSAQIAEGTIGSALIQDLEADNAKILAGVIRDAFVGTAQITTAQIANGAITDALISNLSASKINSGVINTNLITVQGEDGLLTFKNNRIQVFDNEEPRNERVSIGDVNDDGTAYGLRVRGADGKTVLYDENGVYNEGITDGAITNPKIEDDAIDSRVIKANSILAEHILAGQIKADHIFAGSITTEKIQAGAITAESGIIADLAIGTAQIANGAITNAQIANASITDAKIESLNADKIVAGKVKAEFIEIGEATLYEEGYNPTLLDDKIRKDLRLESPLPTNITLSNEGITAALTNDPFTFARLDGRGLYVHNGAIQIVGGLNKNQMNPDDIQAWEQTTSEVTKILDDDIITPFEKITLLNTFRDVTSRKTEAANKASRFDLLVHTDLNTALSNMNNSYQSVDDLFNASTGILSNMEVDFNATGIDVQSFLDDLYGNIRLVNEEIEKASDQKIQDALNDLELSGLDTYAIDIESSNGNIFKNGNISTVLTVKVYKNNADVTSTISENQLIWKRTSENSTEDEAWNTAHSSGNKSINLTISDVTNKATFTVDLLI